MAHSGASMSNMYASVSAEEQHARARLSAEGHARARLVQQQIAARVGSAYLPTRRGGNLFHKPQRDFRISPASPYHSRPQTPVQQESHVPQRTSLGESRTTGHESRPTDESRPTLHASRAPAYSLADRALRVNQNSMPANLGLVGHTHQREIYSARTEGGVDVDELPYWDRRAQGTSEQRNSTHPLQRLGVHLFSPSPSICFSSIFPLLPPVTHFQLPSSLSTPMN